MRRCIDSVQDRDYWRALESATLNLQVSEVMELVNKRYVPTHQHDEGC